jgi:mannose/fructose/N-acetylgalactosamine-specific phosphotransferase system component IIC
MIIKIILTSIIGAICNLDNSLIGNIMISRPIFIGPFLGLILGDFKIGLEIGFLFEFLFADVLYAGTAIPLNITLLTALVLGCNAVMPQYGDALVMFVIILSIPMVYIMRQVEIGMRAFNSHIANTLSEFIKDEKYGHIYMSMFHSIFIFVFVNFILLFVCIVLTSELAKILFFELPYNIISALNLTYSVLPVLGFAVVLNIFLYGSVFDYIKKMFSFNMFEKQ